VLPKWSDEEVARRWLRLVPNRNEGRRDAEEPTQPEINMIVNQPEVLAERRRRLSDGEER